MPGMVRSLLHPGAKDERYMMLGFTEDAKLDEDNFWPTSFALKDLTAAEETKITALVKKLWVDIPWKTCSRIAPTNCKIENTL